jgi:esterase/lipase superfamily enzyme
MQLGFTGKRSKNGGVFYGRCIVNVPVGHKMGSTGSGWLMRLIRGDDRLKVISIDPLKENNFWSQIISAFEKAEEGASEALLFVHGYRVTFKDAALRTAQLAYDLKIRDAVFYSWPSAGKVMNYTVDEASAKNAIPKLAEFLKHLDICAFEAGKPLNVLAHSMGNRVLLGAMQNLLKAGWVPKAIDKLIFAAPDEDSADFTHAMNELKKVGDRKTLYASSKDKPVWLSEVIHGYPRAGLIPPVTVADGMDTVDASELELTFLGHSDFATERPLIYDLYQLIKAKLAAKDRQGLEKIYINGVLYWRIN